MASKGGITEYWTLLCRLHSLHSEDERKLAWRRGLASLSAAIEDYRPLPLEGLPTDGLLSSVQVAISDELVDDVGFLSPTAGAKALYELASVLPESSQRRELSQRVSRRMLDGPADAFVAIASAVATNSGRAFESAALGPRVALTITLPLNEVEHTDALALALLSSGRLQRSWLMVPSTGSGPQRRLAARLLLRAARETAHRVNLGDDAGLRVFEQPIVRDALQRLLRDPDARVWPGAACARGLLSRDIADLGEQIDKDRDEPSESSTYIRAATSIAASIAVRRGAAVQHCRELLHETGPQAIPALTAAVIQGLPLGAPVEPYEVGQLLQLLIGMGGLPAARALLRAMPDFHDLSITEEARDVAIHGLKDEQRTQPAKLQPDDRQQLRDLTLEELENYGQSSVKVADQLREGLAIFAQQGPNAAHAAASRVLIAARATTRKLEQMHSTDGSSRKLAFRLMHDLNSGMLEGTELRDLILLEGMDPEFVRPLTQLFEQLTVSLLSHERQPHREGDRRPLELREMRLKLLMRLAENDDYQPDVVLSQVRNRRKRILRLMLQRARLDEPDERLTPLVQSIIASGGDALLRDGGLEFSDLLLAIAGHIGDGDGIRFVARNFTSTDLSQALDAMAKLVDASGDDRGDTTTVLRAQLAALRGLIAQLPSALCPRVAALRLSLIRLAQITQHLLFCKCRKEALSHWEEIVKTLDWNAHLCAAARRHLGEEGDLSASVFTARMHALGTTLACHRTEEEDDQVLAQLLQEASRSVRDVLPAPFASVVDGVFSRICELPSDASVEVHDELVPPERRPLPRWIPASRCLGEYYVEGTLGNGALATVFAAVRNDERDLADASAVAVKVPTYSSEHAHSLSVYEFERLFQEEAPCLEELPTDHPNLVRLIAVDLDAKPRGAIVTEFVSGISLARMIALRALDSQGCIDVLRGTLAGLHAMHMLGIAHLALKPSNIRLRSAQVDAKVGQPVLVDLSMAGRRLRPGCAKEGYAAPEIWNKNPPKEMDPRPADIYALGCIAWEMWTGTSLPPIETCGSEEDAEGNDVPALVLALENNEALRPMAKWLSDALHRDPAKRATVEQLTEVLENSAGQMMGQPWPLPTDLDVDAAE